jgi:hypothetical protein
MAKDDSSSQDADRSALRVTDRDEAKPTAAGDREAAARLTVWAEVKDGRREELYRGESAWHAMHWFATAASRRVPAREADARDTTADTIVGIGLDDARREFGIRAQRNGSGELELQFDNQDTRAMYRKVVRERQMETSRTAGNSISAVPPVVERQGRTARTGQDIDTGPSAGRSDAASVDRRELDERLTKRETEGPDEQRRLEIDRMVVRLASAEQLKLLVAASRVVGDADALDKALRAVQAEIERDVVREQSDDRRADTERAARSEPGAERGRMGAYDRGALSNAERARGQPQGVDERFTVSERLASREYWFRDRPDRLAFTQTWLTLRTAEHSTAALMGMVDRAQELGWRTLHLNGTQEFKREAWVLATSRGLDVVGYTPTLGDREAALLERQRGEKARARDAAEQGAAALARGGAARVVGGRRQAADVIRAISDRDAAAGLTQVLRKAMTDARVPPELEGGLLQALERRGRALNTTNRAVGVQVWDPSAAALGTSRTKTGAAKLKERPRER